VRLIAIGAHAIGRGPTAGYLDNVIAKLRHREGPLGGKTGGKARHHRHIREVEATWRASGDGVVIHREVAIAIGIRARRSYMRRIQNVGIDEGELCIYQYVDLKD